MERLIHIRFEGKSFDIPIVQLDIGNESTERQIKTALANYLDVADSRLGNYVVEVHESGNITVRPEAVFG
jgi:hypothetical protein